MKSFLVLFLLCFSSFPLFSQFAENIRTGRPGQSIGAYTVGKGIFQVQSGANYLSNSKIIDTGIRSFTFGNILRYGILENLEMSAVVNLQNREDITIIGSQNKKGISNTQIGFRYNIFKRKGKRPALGIQGRLLLKAQDKDFQRKKLGSKFLLAAGTALSDKVSIISNIGLTWVGNELVPNYSYTLSTSFSITKNLSTFTEIYGNFNGPSLNFDTGLAYRLNSDFQLDISGGYEGDSTFFGDLGFSWRFLNRERRVK